MELGNEAENGYIFIEGCDTYDTDSFILISENENVAKVNVLKCSGHLATFEVIPISDGETYIYSITPDGSVISEKLRVVVTLTNAEPINTTAEIIETPGESTLFTESEISNMPVTEDTVQQTDPVTEEFYVLNTNTKKIHRKDCSSVSKISPKNYATTENVQEKLDEGYVWCKICGINKEDQ